LSFPLPITNTYAAVVNGADVRFLKYLFVCLNQSVYIRRINSQLYWFLKIFSYADVGAGFKPAQFIEKTFKHWYMSKLGAYCADIDKKLSIRCTAD